MDLADIVGRLRAVGCDTTSVEVKSASGGLPKSIVSTMCAFANLPGGGLVILGLDESSGFVPVRLSNAATLAAGVVSIARSSFEPPLKVSVEVESFEGYDVVVGRIMELELGLKPCIVKRTGHSFVRFFDGDYTLSRLEMDGFIANRNRPRYDEAEAAGSQFDDLEAERVDDFLAVARASDRRFSRITDSNELLRRTGVVSTSGIPTVAGLLALGHHPQQFLPHCTVRAAILAEGASSSSRALDATTFTGPLAVMLDDIVEWVARNSRHRLVSDPATGHVREVLDPPPTAVRELVSNALVHRDLADWASSRVIELRMTPSSFRLTNPGGLYGITVDRLGTHPLTSPRNRRLIEMCKYVRTADGNMVEALASGIPATFASLRASGMRDPEFFDQGLAFTVTLDRSEVKAKMVMSRVSSLTQAELEVFTQLDVEMSVESISQVLGITINAAQKRLASLRSKGFVVLHGGRGRSSTYLRS